MQDGLIRGLTTIIDDGIGQEEPIDKIIENLHELGYPTCEITSLDDAERFVDNLIGSSIFILDWNMYDYMEDEEIQVPDHLKEEIHERVIELIKKIMSRCFAPIFIFTREEDDVITSEIKNRLRKHDLYSEDGSCAIFVMNKGELRDADVLMAIIETWIVENPSIYLIKHWQHHVISAHGFLFWSLYKIHPGWPGILWKASVDEKSDPDSDINEILFRLVMNSSEDIKFDKKIITKNKKYDTKDVIGIIRATMYRSEPNEGFKPGDIFKMNRRYYLNIRPECDTVPGRDRSDLLYCVKGRRVSPKVLGERYDEKKGFDRHIDDVILPFVDGERCVQFNFKSFEIYPKEEIAEKRICRLLPPYITHIQQNFASFIGRIGTPRLPKEVELVLLGRVTEEADETK